MCVDIVFNIHFTKTMNVKMPHRFKVFCRSNSKKLNLKIYRVFKYKRHITIPPYL